MNKMPDTPQLAGAADSGSDAPPCSLSSFACVVADPPWNLKMGRARTENDKSESRGGGWAGYEGINALQYPTMTVGEIAALQIPAADDAHLYIWTINKYIRETYDIARAWGFKPSTMLYWVKAPMGIGLGGAFVPCVEPILFCRRGNLPAKMRLDRNWWRWKRSRHSAKPEDFQTIVEQVSPGPYLEMFARRKRPGWAAWGNEITSDVEIKSSENV